MFLGGIFSVEDTNDTVTSRGYQVKTLWIELEVFYGTNVSFQ